MHSSSWHRPPPPQYIRPPFPFPEAWPQLFATQQTTWLTPSSARSQQAQQPARSPHPPPPQHSFPSDDISARVLNVVTLSATASVNGDIPHDSPPSLHLYESSALAATPDVRYSPERKTNDCDDGNDNVDAEDSDDGEYVYGYVLSDEWRNRFRSSMRARQRQKQQQRKQTSGGTNSKAKAKKQQQQAIARASSQFLSDLQRELAAAREREAATRHPLPDRNGADSRRCAAAAAVVQQLETQLSLRFDEFCDAFAPVVWPHD